MSRDRLPIWTGFPSRDSRREDTDRVNGPNKSGSADHRRLRSGAIRTPTRLRCVAAVPPCLRKCALNVAKRRQRSTFASGKCVHRSLSFRDVEDLLAERGIDVSYESFRRWVAKFGPLFARELRSRRPRPTSQWHLEEIAVQIGGKRLWLWRAVDSEGEVLDILLEPKTPPWLGSVTVRA